MSGPRGHTSVLPVHWLRSSRPEALVSRALAFPDFPPEWKHADFSLRPEPTLCVRLTRGDLNVGFLIAVTTFVAPCQVTLEELRVESCFPLDAMTRQTCERLAEGAL